ncbi:40S ribosomal protein S6 [Binucleata daphniae]
MKLNIANPARGLQKLITVDKQTEIKFYDKKIGDIFAGSLISPQFNNFTLRITGGDDSQGFPMKERVNTTKRVRLLLKKGEKGYRCRREGVRKRKSVRGCIVSSEIAVISCVILSEGEEVIEGLNDRVLEQSHLPKRADKLRKLFNLDESVDLEKAIKEIIENNYKEGTKKPRLRITRLVKEEDIQKKKDELEKRRLRKEKFEKEKQEYLRKYDNQVC